MKLGTTRSAMVIVSALTVLASCTTPSSTTPSAAAPEAVPSAKASKLPAIDRQLAEAAAHRNGAALWAIFSVNGNVDTIYMRSAHQQGLKGVEDKIIKAAEAGNLTLVEAQNLIFSARVSARACSVARLSEACEIVGTAPQKELRDAAAKT